MKRDFQYGKFCAYGFLKNLRFFEAFLIVFLLSRGISYTHIGILYAVREISANILEIPSGIAADVLGRRRTLAGSFLLYIASFLMFYLYSSPFLYGLAFLLYGGGEAFRSGTHKGMIADHLKRSGQKDQMVSYYGMTRSWSQLGLALSSLAAGFLVFISGDYDAVFLFSTVPYGINFILILSYPAELDKSSQVKEEGKREALKGVLKESFRAVTDRQILNLINLTALHTAYLKAVKDYIQPIVLALVLSFPFLNDFSNEKRSALLLGAIYFLIYFLTSRASASAGKFSHIKNRSIPILTLLAGLAAGTLSGLLLIAGFPALSIIMFVLIHLIENLRKPLMTGYLTDRVDSRILTTVLSVQSQMKTITTAVLAVLFGLIADRRSVGEAVAFISTGLLLLSLAAMIPRRKINESNSNS